MTEWMSLLASLSLAVSPPKMYALFWMVVTVWLDRTRESLRISNCYRQGPVGRTYLVSSSFAVAICLKLALSGMVGLLTYDIKYMSTRMSLGCLV